jgi:hypothetical protein
VPQVDDESVSRWLHCGEEPVSEKRRLRTQRYSKRTERVLPDPNNLGPVGKLRDRVCRPGTADVRQEPVHLPLVAAAQCAENLDRIALVVGPAMPDGVRPSRT